MYETVRMLGWLKRLAMSVEIYKKKIKLWEYEKLKVLQKWKHKVEHNLRKGENAAFQHSHIFLKCFQKQSAIIVKKSTMDCSLNRVTLND